MSLPFDFVKTRLQKQVPDPVTGVGKYNGGLRRAKRRWNLAKHQGRRHCWFGKRRVLADFEKFRVPFARRC
jgi:hypothetical protein